MNNGELRGVIVPVITPLDENENVDEAAFRKMLRRLIAAGVQGIFVGGSAGEGPLLERAAWRRMAELARDEVGDKVALLCGVMDASARKVCEKIRIIRELGYRRFVLTPTYYIATKTAAEHLRLFGRAREAADAMEMIAYNIPQCTGSRLEVDTVAEMARRGWIRCCKESSGDLEYFRELVRRGKETGFTVLEGDELGIVEALRAGASGMVPVCANIFPETFLRLYEAAVRGDWPAAARYHAENLRLRRPLVEGACWLSGIKYAASRLGIGSARAVAPLEPIDPQQKMKIEELLESEMTI